MENSLPSQQELSLLLNEISLCLDKMDRSQGQLLAALEEISPYFNLKNPNLSLNAGFEAPWKLWKQQCRLYFQSLRQSEEAYQDLSKQMQNLLSGRNTQDPLFQEIARQGNGLSKDLQKRQELAAYFAELEQVLDRIRQQEKITSPQKQKIEDLVFRLQLLF